MNKPKMPKGRRFFIVTPTIESDHRHDVCWTIENGSILGIYGADTYAVLGERQTLAGAKRLALKHGSKRPTVI